MSHARTRRLVAACCAAGVGLPAMIVRHASAATQYNLLVLDPNGGEANGIENGRAVGFDTHGAAIWNNLGTSVTRLTIPTGFQGVAPVAISGSQEVGNGVIAATHQQRALLWNSDGANMVDLSTAGAGTSFALATDGAQQAGATAAGAALWTGTAASYVNLGPTNYAFSEATGVSNGVQVGWGGDSPASNNADALLWHGTASSVSVLRTAAKAFGIHGTQVVGWTAGTGLVQGSLQDAGMWTNATPQSFLDLAPAGTTASELTATNGNQQVGDVSLEFGGATLPLDHHAGVWSSAASSFQILSVPSGDNFSFATGIDAQGDISGFCGLQIAGAVGSFVPVIWQPVPEPSAAAAAALSAALLSIRRSPRRADCRWTFPCRP
jgi:hypothetical protein